MEKKPEFSSLALPIPVLGKSKVNSSLRYERGCFNFFLYLSIFLSSLTIEFYTSLIALITSLFFLTQLTPCIFFLCFPSSSSTNTSLDPIPSHFFLLLDSTQLFFPQPLKVQSMSKLTLQKSLSFNSSLCRYVLSHSYFEFWICFQNKHFVRL